MHRFQTGFSHFQNCSESRQFEDKKIVLNRSNFECNKIHSFDTVHLKQILLAEVWSNFSFFESKIVV